MGERFVLNMQRLRGDGFALERFHENLRDFLNKMNFIQIDEEFDDESEDEMEDGFLAPGGFLQLSFDPSIVSRWLLSLSESTIEMQNHCMGLMAHNAKCAENRKIILANQNSLLNHVANVLET